MKKPALDIGSTWETDLYGNLRASRTRAWFVAGASMCVSAILAAGMLLLIPQHQVQPYVITQDTTTGLMKEVRPLLRTGITENDSLIEAQLVSYVQQRESYDFATVQNAVNTVWIQTVGPAREQWKPVLDASNPENPVALYGQRTTVTARIRSVSRIGPNAAQVRFVTDKRTAGAIEQEEWVSTIGFEFSTGEMTTETRWLNPLGFQVTQYHKKPEVTIR